MARGRLGSNVSGTNGHGDLDPVWDDMDKALGQLFMMGWEGTTITPQIKKLIKEQHIGSILLTAKNLKSAEHTTQLVLELQQCAYEAGHPVPLTIGIDQENGGVNSLYDEIYIRQYPSAMGLAATGSRELAYEVAKATAEEIAACGINLILGPCLDVLTNARNQPLGVRTTGDDPHEVSSYGVASMKGYSAAGLNTLGKHFPSYGSLEFLGSTLEFPTITESLESLASNALIPFRNAIEAGLDAMLVGGCAMSSAGLNVMHACLSEQVVTELLRESLNFKGVIVSDCLEMEALSHNIGVGGGTVMAINAGCDIVLLCRSFAHQQQAIEGLKLGIENCMLTKNRIRASLRRVLAMKAKSTSWEVALNPPGISLLSTLQPTHTTLSTRAYSSSITVVRDKAHLLPLTNIMDVEDELLLLTPLVKPLIASAASRALSEQASSGMSEPACWERNASVMSGERVFRELGRSLARQRNGRVLHTSYTTSGVRPQHENLIHRAKAVIIVTADANRHVYQNSFTRHVSMICNTQYASGGKRVEKPVIVVAVSSPYDFAMDQSIGTYICTYDFTETALESLVRVLFGEIKATGSLPGTISHSQKMTRSKQHWLVETYNDERDSSALDALIRSIVDAQTSAVDSPIPVDEQTTVPRSTLSGVTSSTFLLRDPLVQEAHFVVRNSSTKALYGFCTTYFFRSTNTGVIGSVLVDPSRRNLSIGYSLHDRAIRTLLNRDGVKRFQLGSRLPSVFGGIPSGQKREQKRLRSWFSSMGWNLASARPVRSMIARGLSTWTPPKGLSKALQIPGVEFELVFGYEHADAILGFVRTHDSPGLQEVYKLALGEPAACGIIRARKSDGTLVGCVVLCSTQAQLAEYYPALKDVGEVCGGICSPIVSGSEPRKLLEGLALLGLRYFKAQGCGACLMDHVDGESDLGGLGTMGFGTLQGFEEITCDAAGWPTRLIS